MIIFLLLLFIITYLLITGRAASGNCKAAETYNSYSETQRTATSFEIQMREKEAKFTLWAKEQYAELISWSHIWIIFQLIGLEINMKESTS